MKAKLSLAERVYCCEHCGLSLDRDVNAALNIEKYAAQGCGEALNDQGDESAGYSVKGSETVSLRTDKLNRESILV